MAVTGVRYYYSFLSGSEKRIFNNIYDQLSKMNREIQIPGNTQNAFRIIQYVLLDCPEFFYVDNTQMSASGSILSTTVTLKFTKNMAEIRMIQKRLEDIANKVLEIVQQKSMNNMEAVRYVHDLVLKNTEYDHVSRMRQDASGDASTICGVFLNHTAVCKGIALAVKWLLDKIGIQSGVIEGRVLGPDSPRLQDYTGEGLQANHAWNIVNLNGCWQYVDVTMDLGASDKARKMISYDYFLRNDRTMQKYLQYLNPFTSCPQETDSYFVRHKVILKDEEILRKYLQYCSKKRVRRIYFQMDGELAQVPRARIEQIVSGYLWTGWTARYNDKLQIYDVVMSGR